MKKINFFTKIAMSIIVFFPLFSCGTDCPDSDNAKGNAIVFANSVSTASSFPSGAYYTTYKLLGCKCDDVLCTSTPKSYSKGDTVYVKSGIIVGDF